MFIEYKTQFGYIFVFVGDELLISSRLRHKNL